MENSVLLLQQSSQMSQTASIHCVCVCVCAVDKAPYHHYYVLQNYCEFVVFNEKFQINTANNKNAPNIVNSLKLGLIDSAKVRLGSVSQPGWLPCCLEYLCSR